MMDFENFLSFKKKKINIITITTFKYIFNVFDVSIYCASLLYSELNIKMGLNSFFFQNALFT